MNTLSGATSRLGFLALLLAFSLATFAWTGCDDGGDGDGDADGDGDVDGDGDSDGDGDGDEVVSLTILHTTDMHHRASGYGPQGEYTPLDTADSDTVVGGFSRLAALINQIRAEQEAAGVPVLVVDSGDFTMGTIYDMTVADPLALRFIQNVGYDAITLGNHEFDYGPDFLATMLTNAQASDTPFDIPIVASNTILSDESDDDDALAAHFESGAILRGFVLDLSNGLRVGFMGVLGTDADTDAAPAVPVTFEHGASYLQGVVDELRDTHESDLVIALSHSGVEDDMASGEDVGLASLDGLNVVASGHTHIAMPEAIDVGGSLVIQPGAYTRYLGRLDLTFNVTQAEIVDYTFTLLDVDDTIEGDADVQATVDAVHTALDPILADAVGVGSLDPVAELDFDLNRVSLAEAGLGNLCADAMRMGASIAVIGSDDPTPFAASVVPNGVVRDNMHRSATGEVTFSDVYNILPLGLSPDPENQDLPGWPLLSVYFNAGELQTICEVASSLAPTMSDTVYLNIGGIRCQVDPDAGMLNTVTHVFLCGDAVPTDLGGDGDIYSETCDTELDLDDTDTTYRLVSDLYTFLMMDMVTTIMPVVPKHADGTPVDLLDPEDYMRERVDVDQETAGIQELANWEALVQFIMAMPDGGGNPDLPDIPESIYGDGGTGMGRLFEGP